MLGLMCASAQEITDKLTTYINNGQLVIYSESSYLSDNSASAITYVDFCPGGIYHYSYDGSYTVKGTQNTSNRNNRAYGAGVAENSGQWKVLEYQGAHYLEILDAYGKTISQGVADHLEFKLERGNLAAGIYHLKLTTPQGPIVHRILWK